jgi:hypothetical protein
MTSFGLGAASHTVAARIDQAPLSRRVRPGLKETRPMWMGHSIGRVQLGLFFLERFLPEVALPKRSIHKCSGGAIVASNPLHFRRHRRDKIVSSILVMTLRNASKPASELVQSSILISELDGA